MNWKEYVASKVKLVTVEPVAFLYMMMIFSETYALQELVYVKSCLRVNHFNESLCSHENKQNQTEAINEAATWNKYFSCVLFGMTLISSLYAGSWCDILGRKIPMMIALLGTLIAACINCALAIFMHSHVAYLFVSSFVSGITFGTSGILTGCFGYVSDQCEGTSRTKRIVVVESMVAFGSMLGKYLSGVFMQGEDYRNRRLNNISQLFVFEAAVAVFTALYLVMRIPRYEILPLSIKDLFSFKHVKRSMETVFRRRDGQKRLKILLLLAVVFLMFFAIVVHTILEYYYVKATLHWSIVDYTRYATLNMGVQSGMMLLGLPLLIQLLHFNDYIIGCMGVVSRCAGLVLFGISTSPTMVYSCVVLYMFSECSSPAMRSLLSKLVETDEKGRIFAFMSFLSTLAWLLGTFILFTIFTEFPFKGFCFEVVACLQLLGLFILIYLFVTRKFYHIHYETFTDDQGNVVSETTTVVAVDPSIN